MHPFIHKNSHLKNFSWLAESAGPIKTLQEREAGLQAGPINPDWLWSWFSLYRALSESPLLIDWD